MANKIRISLEELTPEEQSDIVPFEIGKTYRVAAGVPHWIVSEGSNLVGIILGRDSKDCTRLYPHPILYKPNSNNTALGFYDFN